MMKYLTEYTSGVGVDLLLVFYVDISGNSMCLIYACDVIFHIWNYGRDHFCNFY